MTSVFMPRRGRSDYFYIRAVLEWCRRCDFQKSPLFAWVRGERSGRMPTRLNTVDGEVSALGDGQTTHKWPNAKGLEQKAIAARALSLTAFCFVPPSASHTWCIWFACSAGPVASREGRVN